MTTSTTLSRLFSVEVAGAALTLAALSCLVAAPAQASTVTAHWLMDEAAGATTMVDAGGGHHDGTVTSTVRTGQTGYAGRAYYFNGDGGRVTVPDAATLDPDSGTFDVQVRFRSTVLPSSSVGDYDLIRKGFSYTVGGDWKVEVLETGKAYCLFKGSLKQVSATGTTNVVDGRWHTIGCRTSSAGVALRVDGSTQRSTTSLPGTISNASTVVIGAKNASEDKTTGYLDDITITRG